jgi:GTP-binding protein
MFRQEELDKLAGEQHHLIMDSNPLERERGITIFSKNCSIQYTGRGGREYKINIVDTPGHADFGGEVERVLNMADGCLLLVDAFEGPMPQTRFVLSKALHHNLKPILVVNKVDRPDSRPNDVVNEVFDLFVELEANDDALDFPVLFASAKEGWATTDLSKPNRNLKPVYEAIIHSIPAPKVDPDQPLQMLVTSLEYSDYVGRVAVGKIFAGKLTQTQAVTVIDREGRHTQQKVIQLYDFEGLAKRRATEVQAGDICAVAGLDPVDIGDTIACPDAPSALPIVAIDEPTMSMTFQINNGPFAGQDGKYVTSLQLRDRLEKELQTNVALRMEPGQAADEFIVSGRGLMHLGILLENMRREDYELCVGKPEVIIHEKDGVRQEPIERLVIECPADCQNAVMSLIGTRRSELIRMDTKSSASDYVHMEFMIPSRGLFGLNARLMTATQGRAIMHHTFERYEPMRGSIPERQAGVLIQSETGTVTAYALDALYDRGVFFVQPGERIYEGQVVGEHCKDNDIVINAARAKQLTNMRQSTKDEAARVRPARRMSLEAMLEYVQQDELVEITPGALRIRKRLLKEGQRRRVARLGPEALIR